MIRLAYPQISGKEISKIASLLRSGFLTQGDKVESFEKKLSGYLGVKHAVCVNSGTSALHLSLLAMNIGLGDEVIVPDFTFPAVGNTVALTGARPVLTDIGIPSYNIDASLIEDRITPKTKAIIAVHQFGLPADMEAITRIAARYNLCLIEDAACALGARYKRKKCGSLSEIGVLSFHPRKIITTGEGGAVITNSVKLADKIRALRNHGMTNLDGKRGFYFAGYNYRMTEFQAQLGFLQLERIGKIIKRREELAGRYISLLRSFRHITLPQEQTGRVFQSFVALLDSNINRDNVIEFLRKNDIETTIGTYALHAQPFYRDTHGYKRRDFKNSWSAFRSTISLPLSTKLTFADIKKITRVLKEAIAHESKKDAR